MRCQARPATHLFRAMLIALFLLSLCSCDEHLDMTQISLRNGIAYKKGETRPFSGFIVGKDHKGYQGAPRHYKKRYENGVLNGKSEYWFQNDKLEGIEYYEDGRIHGIASRYYDNGKIRSRIHFVNGLRGGSKGEMFWDRNGKLRKG